MASQDSNTLERYQPCLLDRLLDDNPGNPHESSHARVISHDQYRDALIRDMQWLLNSHAHIPGNGPGCTPKLFEYPDAVKSIVNFGMRQFLGQTRVDPKELETRIAEAINTFELRVNPHTLRVTARIEENAITCEIDGEYWAEPVSLRQVIKTRMDLNTGQIHLE
jgi:type VI secretion system protein ImpF